MSLLKILASIPAFHKDIFTVCTDYAISKQNEKKWIEKQQKNDLR